MEELHNSLPCLKKVPNGTSLQQWLQASEKTAAPQRQLVASDQVVKIQPSSLAGPPSHRESQSF
jgi:hypothetical protein